MSKLRIKNWDKFQHYSNRNPPWIKLYTECLEKYKDNGEENEFHLLPDDAKLTCMLLWLLGARYGGVVPNDDENWLKHEIGIKRVNIKSLLRIGFLEVIKDASNNASVPLSTLQQQGGECSSVSVSSSVSSSSSEGGPGGGFEEFWNLYPRKVGKAAALKAWGIKKCSKIKDKIMDAVRNQKGWEQWQKDGGQFIPHPATWLNQERWNDEELKIEAERPKLSRFD